MDEAALEGEAFRGFLGALADRYAHPVRGFFGPGSPAWGINRDPLIYLGGLRALLMQIAHPKVAQGVADHSHYRTDSLGRLLRTLAAVHAIVFGNGDEAVAAAARVHAIHRRVRGTVRDSSVRLADPRYDANSPELLTWVYATLVDSSIESHETFVGTLSRSLSQDYYAESKLFARFFGIDPTPLPETVQEFRAWVAGRVASGQIVPTETARDIARSLLAGRGFLRPLQPMATVIASGMLPERLRRDFGLPWNRSVRAAYGLGVASIRTLAPFRPPLLRSVLAARRADRRCRGDT